MFPVSSFRPFGRGSQSVYHTYIGLYVVGPCVCSKRVPGINAYVLYNTIHTYLSDVRRYVRRLSHCAALRCRPTLRMEREAIGDEVAWPGPHAHVSSLWSFLGLFAFAQ